jgi:hypothetical protein
MNETEATHEKAYRQKKCGLWGRYHHALSCATEVFGGADLTLTRPEYPTRSAVGLS